MKYILQKPLPGSTWWIKQKKIKVAKDKKTALEIFYLVINGIGMIIPIVYVFTSKLDFADYYLPEWVGWLGSLLFLDAIWLLYLSHRDLGRHWTATIGIRDEHKLITTGIYKYIRHPMYAAHLVWAIAQIMILHNWIAGYSFIITMIPFYFYRKRKSMSPVAALEAKFNISSHESRLIEEKFKLIYIYFVFIGKVDR